MRVIDIVLILAGLCFSGLCVYLIVVLRKVNTTLVKVNDLIDKNSFAINSIIRNIHFTTNDVKNISAKAYTGVLKVEEFAKKTSEVVKEKKEAIQSEKNPYKKIFDMVKIAISGFTFVSGAIKRRKINKLIKNK